ncbi:MAG: (2Fe-2S)-binding protein [Chloroflexota bacterium]
MNVTFIGHAGLLIETRHGSILCDPWFNPAYFASWFVFPSNETIDQERISKPTYLYLSHVHKDHYDPEFLRRYVPKDTPVILPDHPLNLIERELRALGFTTFIQTKNNEPLDLDGLRIMTVATVAPADGPLGDSALAVDDGEVRIFDQNDARPVDLAAAIEFGPYDVHFTQFSGAIWYPMVYRFPPPMKQALGRKKRETQMNRALRYARQIGAAHLVPMAGPPCFLDDALFGFNDFGDDPANIFPDQTVFLEFMRANGATNGHLMIPGSVATIRPGKITIDHALPDAEVRAIFTEKRDYLADYQRRARPLIEAEKASWPRGQVDILSSLKAWFEPVLELADRTAAGINGRVLLDCGDPQVVIDFWERNVYPWEGQPCEFAFHVESPLIEALIVDHDEDWVNRLFLSCRFEAERKGAYNEFVYSFFKCLSPERIEYAEGYYAEQQSEKEFWVCDGYRVQRRCPHLKADLTRFGQVQDGILTCTLHGWQFDLATGRCLTTEGKRIFSERIEAGEEQAAPAAERATGDD